MMPASTNSSRSERGEIQETAIDLLIVGSGHGRRPMIADGSVTELHGNAGCQDRLLRTHRGVLQRLHHSALQQMGPAQEVRDLVDRAAGDVFGIEFLEGFRLRLRSRPG